MKYLVHMETDDLKTPKCYDAGRGFSESNTGVMLHIPCILLRGGRLYAFPYAASYDMSTHHDFALTSKS